MKYQHALVAVLIAAPYGHKRSFERDLQYSERKDAQRMEEIQDPHREKIEEAKLKIRREHQAQRKKFLPSEQL